MPTLPDKYTYLLPTSVWYKLRLLIGFFGLGFSLWGISFLFRAYPLTTLPFLLMYFYLAVFLGIATWIGLSYRTFDRVAHWRWRREFQSSSLRPSVDVFLPVCGEPLETLTKTWQAVAALDYPNYQVYVLDDAHDSRVKALAKIYNFHYIARENKGYLKKAGNIRYAFARTKGEYFTIFDADFAPLPEFLYELLPYLIRDKRVAIVQSPQAFEYPESTYAEAPLAYGASLIQEDFYRRTQVGLDTHNATVCVGSNALYRRQALSLVRGAAPIEHSEDLHTGFAMVSAGYKIKYVPLRLAFGGVPDKLGAWVRQQIRWCQGSLALVPTRKFWQASINPATKIAYTSGWLYYYSSFVTLLSPYLTYLVLWQNVSIAPWVGLFYIPVILTNWVFFPRFRTREFRLSLIYVYWLLTYIHVYTIWGHLRRNSPAWVPTASTHTRKTEQQRVLDLVSLNLATHSGLLLPLLVLGRIDFANPALLLVFFWLLLELWKPIALLLYTWVRIENIVPARYTGWLWSRGFWELSLSLSTGLVLGLGLLMNN